MSTFCYTVCWAGPNGYTISPRELDRAQARDLCRRLDLFGRGLLEDLERTALDRGCATYDGPEFSLHVSEVLQDET